MDSEPEPIAWEKDDEIKKTWAGDIAINATEGQAILTVTTTTTETFRLFIPRDRLDSLIRDFDWARHRLEPWPDWRVGGKSLGEVVSPVDT